MSLKIKDAPVVLLQHLKWICEDDPEFVESAPHAKAFSMERRHWEDIVIESRTNPGLQGAVAAVSWPPPFSLPFEHVFFAPDTVAPIPRTSESGFQFVGCLCSCADLTIVGLMPEGNIRLEPAYVDGQRDPKVWPRLKDLVFAVVKMLEIVDSRCSTVVESRMSRASVKKAKKLLRPLGRLAAPPRDYYSIKVADRTSFKATLGMPIAHPSRSNPTYRHDVRGHWRYFVRKGPGELDMGDADRFMDRGYSLAVEDSPNLPDDLQAALTKRGITRQSGGWLAVKRTRVKPHIRGPEDAPYVPAVWRVADKEAA